jgi:hypothetical protein
VFRDLGHPDAGREQLRAILAAEISMDPPGTAVACRR